MKRNIMLILWAAVVMSGFSQEKESEKTINDQRLRLSGEFLLPVLPGFSSIGLGAQYRVSDRVDLYGEMSILLYPLTQGSLSFHSTGGGRFYLSDESNSLYLEAGGGVFGGVDESRIGVLPLVTGNLGYEFELAPCTMNVDLGLFCIIDTSFLGVIPLPVLSGSIFF